MTEYEYEGHTFYIGQAKFLIATWEQKDGRWRYHVAMGESDSGGDAHRIYTSTCSFDNEPSARNVAEKHVAGALSRLLEAVAIEYDTSTFGEV